MSQVQCNAMQFTSIQKCFSKYNYIANVHVVYAGCNCSECTGDEQDLLVVCVCRHVGVRGRTFQTFHFKIAVSLLTSP